MGGKICQSRFSGVEMRLLAEKAWNSFRRWLNNHPPNNHTSGMNIIFVLASFQWKVLLSLEWSRKISCLIMLGRDL